MSPTAVAAKQQASIKIPLTEGNIRNGHVYLREYLWFFPKTAIRGERSGDPSAESCILELPSGSAIETDIDAGKAIFRWRGWRKLFRQMNAAAGDSVVFTRLERGRYGITVEHNIFDGIGQSNITDATQVQTPRPTRTVERCNDLSGDEWLRYSLSIWSDIRKTQEESSINHPAMFPSMLCERLISMFLPRRGGHQILDPFMGSGSTLLAARNLGKTGIGFEISPAYVELATARLEQKSLFQKSAPPFHILPNDARQMEDQIKPASIDLCITSPPYWDILNQKRSADNKEVRHYGNLDHDLGIIADYERFLAELQSVFKRVLNVLRPGAYCAVVVMDIRKKSRFFPFHTDLADRLTQIGFIFDDLIIWDRRHEYNNLRPLGYPAVFRVNKVHEYILLFQRPVDLA